MLRGKGKRTIIFINLFYCYLIIVHTIYTHAYECFHLTDKFMRVVNIDQSIIFIFSCFAPTIFTMFVTHIPRLHSIEQCMYIRSNIMFGHKRYFYFLYAYDVRLKCM